MLPDGTYDVIIVDAESTDDERILSLDVALASGDRRGEMLTLSARDLGRDALDLLAVPATLTVTNGEPSLALEG